MPTTAPHPDPAEAALHREHLLRFARRRLRDAALAEDVVHEVLVTVCEGRARFEQRSSLRTWLVAILKHKIVDAVRQRRPECSLDATDDEGEALFEPPAPECADPMHHAEQRQLLIAALRVIAAQPEPRRRAFEMHALWGEDMPTICTALDTTPDNVWVRVHRVRQALRPLRAAA